VLRFSLTSAALKAAKIPARVWDHLAPQVSEITNIGGVSDWVPVMITCTQVRIYRDRL